MASSIASPLPSSSSSPSFSHTTATPTELGLGIGVSSLVSSSSSTVALNIIKEALTGVDDEYAAKHLNHEKIDAKTWRFDYGRHFLHLASLSAANNKNARSIAANALKALSSSVVYRYTDSGVSESILFAVQRHCATLTTASNKFVTVQVQGQGQINRTFTCPDMEATTEKRTTMSGSVFKSCLSDWESRGIIEPDAARALREVSEDDKMRDLRGKIFVLIGAGSQLGPARSLLSYGATVVAIDIPGSKSWPPLIEHAKNSPGNLLLPVLRSSLPISTSSSSSFSSSSSSSASSSFFSSSLFGSDQRLSSVAGADLLVDSPHLAHWLVNLCPDDNLTIGSYVYLDGAKFVILSACVDAILSVVCSLRGPTCTSDGQPLSGGVCLSGLLSPTEIHCIPSSAVSHARSRYNARTVHDIWRWPVKQMARGKWLQPNTTKDVTHVHDGGRKTSTVHILDSLVVTQGPNYAFAKQLQKWRLLLQRMNGFRVSSLVAPASLTDSVMHNKLIAAGMYGASHFLVDPFGVLCASSLMSLLLIYDIYSLSPFCLSSPFSSSSLVHASEDGCVLEYLTSNAVHGGTFRCPFRVQSFTELSAAVHYARQAKPYLLASAALGAGRYIYRSAL